MMKGTPPLRKSKLLYWPSTLLLAMIYLVTGIGNVVPFDHIAADMHKLGYPAYFMPFLGVCKLLAALALVLPVSRGLKQFAYIGILIDLTGAIYSRAAIHDPFVTLFIPVLIAILAAVSWLTGV